MIPEAAVEAAAKILYERDGFLDALDAAPTHRKHRYLDEAERLLEAAAPFMRQAFFLEMNLKAVASELAAPPMYPRS